MEQYPSNSHKARAERKKKAEENKKQLSKVITGTVKRKKKSELSKLKDTFISEDASSVKDYIIRDVIIPTAIDTLVSIIKNGTDIIFYGTTKKRSNLPGTKVHYASTNYNSISKKSDMVRRYARNEYDFDDITFDSRGDAEAVLMTLDDILDTYSVVSVADYYDVAGVSATPSDDDYGWDNLKPAQVVKTREGWTIKFPRAKQLD